MQLQEAKEAMECLLPQHNSTELRIIIHQPGGLGPSPTVGIRAIHAGFDWNSNTILIYPEEQLTRLTSDEVAVITKSVSKGQSWHTQQQFKKLRQQLAASQQENSMLKQQLQEIFERGEHGQNVAQ